VILKCWGGPQTLLPARDTVRIQLTDFSSFLQHDYSDFFALLPFELFEPNRSTETCRASSNDAYVDLILCPLYVGRIKGFASSERCRMEPPAKGEPPRHKLLRSPSEHCGRCFWS
jgi:hypothetical protein